MVCSLHLRKVSAWSRIALALVLLLITAHRLPAPIQEAPEGATPTPEQSAKPKPKRTTKPESKRKNSETPPKRQTPSPPQSKSTPQRNPFDGTWVGTLNNAPFHGNLEVTLIISASGTSVTEKTNQTGTRKFQATSDGSTMRWTSVANCAWTLTPNPDGKTALATDNCPGLFGVGVYNISTVFRRTSP